MKTELSDRGNQQVTDTRLGQYINRAKARLDNMYRWPYREESGVGIPPVIIADLGQVEVVTNQSRDDYPLQESSYKDLTEWYGDLTITGLPIYWYRAYSSGNPIVATYPTTTTDTIGVQYWKRTPVLTGTDIPKAPEDYHMLIVDIAQMMVYRETDAHALAETMRPEITQQILEMIEDLLPQQDVTFQRTTWHASEDW